MVAKFLDLSKRWSQIWLKKNWHVQCMTIIPVHYCTQEKSSSPNFSSIVLTMQMAVSVKKDY